MAAASPQASPPGSRRSSKGSDAPAAVAPAPAATAAEPAPTSEPAPARRKEPAAEQAAESLLARTPNGVAAPATGVVQANGVAPAAAGPTPVTSRRPSLDMGSRAFVIPAGLELTDTPDGLNIEYDGDIILHSSIFGRPFHRICSRQGSVRLHMDTVEVKELIAEQGELVVEGSLLVDTMLGRDISIAGDLKAREVRCSSLKVEKKLEADLVTATDGDVQVRGAFNVSEELTLNGGDLVVEGDLTAKVECISVPAGSVTVAGKATVKNLETGRDARFSGDLEASEVRVARKMLIGGAVSATALRASAVHLRGPSINVRVVQGQSQIHAGAAKVDSNIFIAPSVHLDPNLAGCLKVLEAKDLDQRPLGLKGCLQLKDLADLFSSQHVEQLLGSNSLKRLEQEVASWEDPNFGVPKMPPARQVDPSEGLGGRRHSDVDQNMRVAAPGRNAEPASTPPASQKAAAPPADAAVANGKADKAPPVASAPEPEEDKKPPPEPPVTAPDDKKAVEDEKEEEAAPAKADAVAPEPAAEAPSDAEKDAEKPAEAAPPAEEDGKAAAEPTEDSETARQEARKIRKERKRASVSNSDAPPAAAEGDAAAAEQ
eukprot:TRINITY_DN27765_c0_g1_i1.p1 TRINITY_DN27765_c0_g1~~TRINITY_DN27765_c0_g1_i1.p1  ORF type:complete len:601 (+),score=196.41 TRINITY_DN27765_c0_g1_i1:107-1909(+)